MSQKKPSHTIMFSASILHLWGLWLPGIETLSQLAHTHTHTQVTNDILNAARLHEATAWFRDCFYRWVWVRMW